MTGNEAVKANRLDEAVQQYTLAIQNDGSNAVYYCNRCVELIHAHLSNINVPCSAAALSLQGKHDASIQDCEAAVKLDPTYGKAYSRMGCVLLHSWQTSMTPRAALHTRRSATWRRQKRHMRRRSAPIRTMRASSRRWPRSR